MNLLRDLEPLPYFTIEAVKQLCQADTAPGTVRMALYRWSKVGAILPLKKGVYITRHFYEQHRADEDFGPMVSAIILPQSYLSLEYILQRSGILTDVTYPVTAVTRKQTRVIKNRLGTFSYRHIQEDLYQGFTFSEYMGIPIARATAAKALFDWLYFRPCSVRKQAPNYNLAEDLRLNLRDMPGKDRDEFAGYVALSNSQKMSRILENLRKTVWQA